MIKAVRQRSSKVSIGLISDFQDLRSWTCHNKSAKLKLFLSLNSIANFKENLQDKMFFYALSKKVAFVRMDLTDFREGYVEIKQNDLILNLNPENRL